MMDETEPTDEVFAYHEAGHAVVACALSRPIEFVTLDHDGQPRNGYCSFGDLHPVDLIAVTLAGDIAETTRIGKPSFQRDDQTKAIRDAIKDGERYRRPPEELWWRCCDLAQQIIREEWSRVLRLAPVLVKKRTIEGKEVESIVGMTHEDKACYLKPGHPYRKACRWLNEGANPPQDTPSETVPPETVPPVGKG